MNVLDENVVENQCRLLRSWHIRFRQIGFGVGRQGMKDEEIISLLHKLLAPPFSHEMTIFITLNYVRQNIVWSI